MDVGRMIDLISEFVLNIVFNIVEGILSRLPVIDISFNSVGLSTFWGLVRCALYMLPGGTITSIIGVLVAIGIFRVVVSFIRTIWDLLPIA